MDIIYIALGAIILFYLINKFLSKGIKSISIAQLKYYLEDKSLNYQYIDVRTPSEFKSKKIKQFKNMPLDSLEQSLNKLSKDQNVVLICQSGARSSVAARKLVKAGFDNVLNVRGGMNMWRD